jgi:hypothetical protein
MGKESSDRSSPDDEKKNVSPSSMIRIITKPGSHDVLLGRGGRTNNHIGNKKFRELVNQHKIRYLNCSKVDKPRVSRDVVDIWKKQDPPGRFLQKVDDSPDTYQEVIENKARGKASQCLRERTRGVPPCINQLHKEHDELTEKGDGMVKRQMMGHNTDSINQYIHMNSNGQGSSMGDQLIFLQTLRQTGTTPIASSLIDQSQPTLPDIELQQLCADPEQQLRDVYTNKEGFPMTRESAVRITHQQYLAKQHALAATEQQAFQQQQIMMQQLQFVMTQNQMLQNDMSQELSLQQHTFFAPEMNSSEVFLQPRRQSLTSNFSQMQINAPFPASPPLVTSSPKITKNMLNTNNPNVEHIMANVSPPPGSRSDNLRQQEIYHNQMATPAGNRNYIEPTLVGITHFDQSKVLSKKLQHDRSKEERQCQKVRKQMEPRNFSQSLEKCLEEPHKHVSCVPRIIATSSIEDDELRDLDEYKTELNDFSDYVMPTDPNMYEIDDEISEEELLKDHSKSNKCFDEFLDDSAESPLRRKPGRRIGRNNSKMSTGNSSSMSLSASSTMDFSRALSSREQRMSSVHSLASCMSELTDY